MSKWREKGKHELYTNGNTDKNKELLHILSQAFNV